MREGPGCFACLSDGCGPLKTTWLPLPYFSDRKKVLDFYQRACLSGYCSAFAYKPMNCTLSSQLNGKCIELVQVPGQNSIFTMCELPSTVPIKPNIRRSSWSSDGTVNFRLSQWEWHRAFWGQEAQNLIGLQSGATQQTVSWAITGIGVPVWHSLARDVGNSSVSPHLKLGAFSPFLMGFLRCSRVLMYIKVFS